jgi:hypothetical protein
VLTIRFNVYDAAGAFRRHRQADLEVIARTDSRLNWQVS